MPIDLQALKKERDRLKHDLRDLEGEQRKIEAQLKQLRQTEVRLKREIEALTTLIEMQDSNGDEQLERLS